MGRTVFFPVTPEKCTTTADTIEPRRYLDFGASGGLPALAIFLDARAAQTDNPVLVDRILPSQEFFDREGVSAACLFERKQAPAHRPRPGPCAG
jgi:hypothetical protein